MIGAGVGGLAFSHSFTNGVAYEFRAVSVLNDGYFIHGLN